MLHISVNIKVTAGAVALPLTVLLRSCGYRHTGKGSAPVVPTTTGAAET